MAQARRKNPDAVPLAQHVSRGMREGALFLLGALAVYLLLALVSYDPADPGWSHSGTRGAVSNLGGSAGAWFADVFLYLFGYLAYLFPVMVGYSGWLVFRERTESGDVDLHVLSLRWLGFVVTVCAGCGLSALHFGAAPQSLPLSAGGILGDVVGGGLAGPFNFVGATLFLLALFLAGVTLFTGLSWFSVMDRTGRITLYLLERAVSLFDEIRDRWQSRKVRREREQSVKVVQEKIEKRAPPVIAPVTRKVEAGEREQKERQVPLFEPSGDSALPPLSLLDDAPDHSQGFSEDALAAMSRLLEVKLQDFGVEVQVVEVHPGPVITRFELQPGTGVKVSQISNLAKDLARALSTISVRVVEVIPGKSTVGIEIPNEHRELVALSEIVKSREYEQTQSPLALALGKDIGGNPAVTDLARMPHLLVAGTTGSGKSVAVNAMILSLVYKSLPSDVRLIMIDPKMLELSIYEGIPHLLTPVVTDMKEAANALRWCVAEMDQRYRLMAALGVRNIANYNKKVREAIDKGEPIPDPLYKPEEAFDPEAPHPTLEPLPYIVVIIDELADLMMVVGKKVEELIARLAQKARAAGVHLILATQRPSVDVITGLIKANIPTRIAFQVSGKVDSRTILDQGGAEQLLGHGDMLYLAPGTGVPTRVHGAFVADHEVHHIVEYLKKNSEPNYIEGVLDGGSSDAAGAFDAGGVDAETDELYDQAVRIVTETRRASISGVQRRLKIGYNRAARMVEQMEAAGVVGPLQSNGSREVLVQPPPAD